MIYRRFGRTEISMPVLSLGCMRSMYRWQDLPLKKIPQESQGDLRAIVHRALELGINHIETARGYGSSERQLAEILAPIPRESYILQSKIKPQEDPAAFEADFHDSLNRLGQKRLDLLTIHGINDHRSLWYACRKGGCLHVARRLQKEGLADHIGFSGHASYEVIKAALEHEEDNGFDYINIHWYFINQGHWPLIKMARAKDMGVFIISPTDKGGMLHTPPKEMRRLCAPLSPILFNDLFCLSHKEISTISIGAARVSDFDEHLKVVPLLDAPNSSPLGEVKKRLEEKMEERCGHKDPAFLTKILPSWEECPGYINVAMILWLTNLNKGWGLKEYAARRYQQLGHDMPWVPGNNAATTRDYNWSEFCKDLPLDAQTLTQSLKEAHKELGTKSAS